MYWTFDNETGNIVSAKHEPILSPEQEIDQSKLQRGGYCGTCQTEPCLVESGQFCCHYAVKGWNCAHQSSVSAYPEQELQPQEAVDEEKRLLNYDDPNNHSVREKRTISPGYRPQRPRF